MGHENKKVTIMGLGLLGGGVEVAKFFAKQGARVLVTDLRTKKQLKDSLKKLKGLPIKYVFGRHRAEDFKNADLVIKNPGVPPDSLYLKIAKKHRISIETDISIFFKLCKAPIIGVTGTKGKSTTATLIYLFLKTKCPSVFLAGNIGVSPLEILPKIKKNSKIILELSSFELEDLKQSPKIAVITTLFPDHLNRYKSFKDYIEAKKPIFKYQKKNDILVLNYDNPETRKLAKEAHSKVYFFTPLEVRRQRRLPMRKRIGLLTGFRDSNISAAIKVAEIFKIPEKNIQKTLANFKGISNRQELIATKRGVRYINDTTATTPQSVILAINTFKKRFPGSKIILIAGGQDKNLNYCDLAEEIKKKVSSLLLLPGTASDKLKRELSGFEKIIIVGSMKEAVKKAEKVAQRDDVVLLSPGAASFNLFDNEFDRGEQFIKAIKKLKPR